MARGVLYVVATPIGNLDDLSPRAAAILAEVDLVLAEDTRVTGRLMRHLGIRTELKSCHEHNERGLVADIVRRLRAGQSMALVSDAGTPLLSDPGYHLTKGAHEADVEVRTVPGPCSITAALSVAGLNASRFVFDGFPPARRAARRSRFEQLRTESRTLVFLEVPHRVLASVGDMAAIFGARRPACLAKELTKLHETVMRASLFDLREWLQADAARRKGEFVIVVDGAADSSTDHLDPSESVAVLLKYLSVKDAAAAAAELTGLPKRQMYDIALSLRQQVER
jgi:16S rRNA (cytidine1402-2'-O)-methyltransferase